MSRDVSVPWTGADHAIGDQGSLLAPCCGADLTHVIAEVVEALEDLVRRCPGCGRQLYLARGNRLVTATLVSEGAEA